VHDATDGWSVPTVLMLVISVVLLVPGLGAGRNRTIGEEHVRDEQHAAA
jgi:CP family cyanate transporter-like MFS transporter